MPNCTEIPDQSRSNIIYRPNMLPLWEAQRAWHVEGAISDDDARFNATPIDGSDMTIAKV